jgi:hypothetical protein
MLSGWVIGSMRTGVARSRPIITDPPATATIPSSGVQK